MYADFEFTNLLKELKERREKVNKYIAAGLKGSIVPDRQYGRTYLICYTRDANGNETKIRLTKRPDLLHSLMRKKYLEAEAGLLEKNIAALERFSAKYEEIIPGNIIKALPQTYRELPEKLFFIPTEAEIALGLTDIAGVAAYEELCEELGSLRRANKGKSGSNARRGEKPLRKNAAGRKTECDNRRICGIESSGWSGDKQGLKWLLVPDFTIRRRDGSLCYWEHCGLMSDAGLFSSAIHLYRTSGLWRGAAVYRIALCQGLCFFARKRGWY